MRSDFDARKECDVMAIALVASVLRTAQWLDTEPAPAGYRRVVVPDVAPWSLPLLLFEAGADG